MGRRADFTFIELLAAIALMSIIFMPMLAMFSIGLRKVDLARRQGIAVGLANEELQLLQMRADSLDLSGRDAMHKRKLKDAQGREWIVVRRTVPRTEPLEIRIEVFSDDQPGKQPDFDLVTYIMSFHATGATQ